MEREKLASTTTAQVVDLFCGIGALSHGLKRAGLSIVAGYDVDARCKYAFETNNEAQFFARDVGKLTAAEIKSHFSHDVPSVLAGCAPCQPFSTYKQRYQEDPQWSLVNKFGELAAEVRADFVTMENVPSLLKYKNGQVFDGFCDLLANAGYSVRWCVANCERFGIPQKRKRLVVMAALDAEIEPLTPQDQSKKSVWDAISNLPPLAAGEVSSSDPMHKSASLTALNLKRIRASIPGGTWKDWPESLRANCHRRLSGKTYPGVYARMSWKDAAPTITTQCYGFGNGRFGHPEQDRAISLREAAILQTFPLDYKFLPDINKATFKELGRWIGNAVPVALAEEIGHSILQSLRASVIGARYAR